MSLQLIVALAILAFAAGFHLYWAMGGRLGLSVSLPQRTDGMPVMANRLGWWRPAAGGVALGLAMLGALAFAAEGHSTVVLTREPARVGVAAAGAAFLLRAVVPTPWTGFFKTIRTTRWARYDTWLYSPLLLLLGAALLAVALR